MDRREAIKSSAFGAAAFALGAKGIEQMELPKRTTVESLPYPKTEEDVIRKWDKKGFLKHEDDFKRTVAIALENQVTWNEHSPKCHYSIPEFELLSVSMLSRILYGLRENNVKITSSLDIKEGYKHKSIASSDAYGAQFPWETKTNDIIARLHKPMKSNIDCVIKFVEDTVNCFSQPYIGHLLAADHTICIYFMMLTNNVLEFYGNDSCTRCSIIYDMIPNENH